MFDFDATKSEYEKFYPSSPFFDTWVPESKFLSAEIDGQGNISISREDGGIYGIALGAQPVIPDNWKNFSLESRGISALPKDFKVVVEWDAYWAATKNAGIEVSTVSSNEVIKEFLETHAADSSVFPGHKEIVQWVEVFQDGQLAAVAALCRWQSGRIVIASVATHTELRGRGLGKQLIEKCLNAGGALGEKSLSLGVRHQNESAQRLYRSTGFTLMHNFTYCERR